MRFSKRFNRGLGFLYLGVLLGAGLCTGQSQAVEPQLPAAPQLYAFDEPQVLKPKTVHALHRLLHEHDQLTGEQIVIAVFKSLQGQDLVQWTHLIFQKWALGQKGKDNGALLALYWQDRQMRLEVGYGLEGELTDAKSKAILTNDLQPLLKDGRPDEALTSAAYRILSVLESPLIENGKALEILQSEGFSDPTLNSEANSHQALGAVIAFFLFVVMFLWIFVVYYASRRPYRTEDELSREGELKGAQDSSASWGRGRKGSHRSQWSNIFKGGGGGWGGGSSSGGGGSFSGGGGSSGGGGASGRW